MFFQSFKALPSCQLVSSAMTIALPYSIKKSWMCTKTKSLLLKDIKILQMASGMCHLRSLSHLRNKRSVHLLLPILQNPHLLMQWPSSNCKSMQYSAKIKQNQSLQHTIMPPAVVLQSKHFLMQSQTEISSCGLELSSFVEKIFLTQKQQPKVISTRKEIDLQSTKESAPSLS